MNSGHESSPDAPRARRPYRSALRAEQADLTRRRIIAAAAELFNAQGYARTTLQVIADTAGVSVQSVQANGPKSALLLATLEFVVAGVEGFESMADVPDIVDMQIQFATAEDLIHALALFSAAANERSTGIWQALERAAEEEPAVADTLRSLVVRMRSDGLRAIEVLGVLGTLRADRTHSELADVYWALTLPDLYVRLVRQAEWQGDRYAAWLEESLREALLESPDPGR